MILGKGKGTNKLPEVTINSDPRDTAETQNKFFVEKILNLVNENKSSAEDSATEKSATEKPAAEKSSAGESSADKSSAQRTFSMLTSEKSSSEKSSTEKFGFNYLHREIDCQGTI